MSFIYKPLERIATYVSAPTRTKFAFTLTEGSREDKDLLSVKGANLCELNRLGHVVPPAFILSTEAAVHHRKSGLQNLDPSLVMEIQLAVQALEESTGRQFGNTQGSKLPLLLTVRGGSAVASELLVGDEENDLILNNLNNEVLDVLGAPESWCFPGIKESCLGIGLTDRVVEQIAQMTSKTFAYNAYSHFLIRYGTIVLDVPKSRYRKILNDFASTRRREGELTEQEVFSIHEKFKEITALPQDPLDQLTMAVRAMYECWFETEATLYRQDVLNLPLDTGLALIIQAMVIGDTGIAFSRNPVSGYVGDGIFGCLWTRDGVKTSLQEYSKSNTLVVQKLIDSMRTLEYQFLDMVQVEFVIDEFGTVNLLQVNQARRTPRASIHVAVDFNRERLISDREAVLRINAKHPSVLWRYEIDPSEESIATAQTANRGIAVGALAFNAVDCVELLSIGQNVILVQLDADNTDERVLRLCDGLILLRGNVISPPATLCRALGKPCVTAVAGVKLRTFEEMQFLEINEFSHLGKGAMVTVNASTGKIFRGECKKVPNYNENYFRDILSWANNFRTIRIDGKVVTGNLAENVTFCNNAGADNIGVVYTDHMFLSSDERLTLIRLALIAKSMEDRSSHLLALQNLFEKDFNVIIRSLLASSTRTFDGQIPLGVKLLDVSLGSFLREKEINIPALATHMDVKVSDIKEAVSLYHDRNPDIGLRGCRISATHPEITEMQLAALFRAVLSFEPQMRIKPHIWIPAVSTSHELSSVISLIENVYRTVSVEIFYIVLVNTPQVMIRFGYSWH